MKHKMILAVALTMAALISGGVAAGEAELTKEKIDALIKELGNEEFAKRQAAEAELAKAGAKAEEALKAASVSTDPQIKATVGRLLVRLKIANLGPVNYLDAIPANVLVAVHATNIGQTVESAKLTALGKLIEKPEMAPFKDKLKEAINRDPAAKKKVLTWLQRFQGQAVGAVWDLNILAPEGSGLGAVLEVTDPDPKAVMGELLEAVSGTVPGGLQRTTYKDIETYEGAPAGGIALLGKHLVLAVNPNSLHRLIDGLLAPGGGLNSSPVFAKAKPVLGPRTDLLVAVDFQAYMNLILGVMPMPGMDQMLASTGAADLQLALMASSVAGDAFEDRFIGIYKQAPKGFASAVIPAENAPAPVEVAALIPANAVAVSVGYVDGGKLGTAFVDYLDGLKKVLAAAPAAPGMDPDAIIKEIEAKVGMKLGEVAKNVKGEVAAWVVLGPGATPPDIGLLITCADAAGAKAVSTALANGINAAAKAPVVKETPYNNRTISQVDVAALGAIPSFPYAPSWAVDGNRIFAASSAMALQKQLTNLDTKAPGLLTQVDFVKALGKLTPDQRKGQLMYADVKALLTAGATTGLPLLQQQLGDPELKKALMALPQPQEMFKDIGPALSSSILAGDMSITVLRAPLPPLSAAVLLGIGVGFVNKSAHAPPVPLPDN